MTASKEDVQAAVIGLFGGKAETLKLREQVGLTNSQVRGLVTDLNQIVVQFGGTRAVTAGEAENCVTIGDAVALVAKKVLS